MEAKKEHLVFKLYTLLGARICPYILDLCATDFMFVCRYNIQ